MSYQKLAYQINYELNGVDLCNKTLFSIENIQLLMALNEEKRIRRLQERKKMQKEIIH